MERKAARDRLEKPGEIDLDAEEDFQDAKNFAVVVTKAGAASRKPAGIADPAEHFQRKTIRAERAVKEVDGVPRVEVNDARQIGEVESGDAAPGRSASQVLCQRVEYPADNGQSADAQVRRRD